MAGPIKQFNHVETLAKALHVFWAKGYAGTSMQDLVTEMGINRASMYQTYGNKHALYVAAINSYIESTLGFIRQQLAESSQPFDKLRALIEQLVLNSLKNKGNGCFINNAAVEMATADEFIAERTRYFWQQLEKIFQLALINGVEQGELAKNTDTKQFALLLNIMLQGLIVKTKPKTSKKELVNSLNALFDLFKK